MPLGLPASFWRQHGGSFLALLLWAGVALLAFFPAPLALLARVYHALCAPFPVLTVPGRIVPPLPLALLFLLGAVVVAGATIAGVRDGVGTMRIARGLDRLAVPIPSRLTGLARGVALDGRLRYLASATPMALCYGFVQPRIAVSAGLLDRLDDEEVLAVLLHERRHAQRRDPLRLLVLRALAAGLFMVPLAPIVQRWVEIRVELAADRAALAVVSRGALGGALAAALGGQPAPGSAIAWWSATEARIAQLCGRPASPAMPIAAGFATLGALAGLSFALLVLARPERLWEVVCALCPGLA